ncbi:MAG: alpha/beta hydrolase, partial [Phycisphaerae bacterium]|nr:alpha/beta hydrolase [Phycisphaerae bacterium]
LTGVAGHKYPACVQDARAAIRWLRSNAKELGVDPSRIGIGGGSAGGHIAAMVMANADLAIDPEADAPIVLKAAMLMAAVLRLMPDPADGLTRESRVLLLGGTAEEIPGRYRAASPMFAELEGCPPTLLLHGTGDRVVSFRQSVEFAERLREAGVPAELELFEGVDHGQLNDEPHLPRQLSVVADFMQRHLIRPA